MSCADSAPPPPPDSGGGGGSCPERMLMLPYGNLDCTLRGLAGQAEGFGRCAIGGLHGEVYRVTTLAEQGVGSLREGCARKEPLWIVFEVSGIIHLSSPIRVSSYKTIDGRSQRIKVKGKGLELIGCDHVIICNLEFEEGRGPDVDAIKIKNKSRHIWIDRCSLSDYNDGLVDISRESTYVTISRCHFSQHNKTVLIGANCSCIEDRCIKVTIHHCFFDGTGQRHPRVRFGKVHLYNNYTRNWGIYAVCPCVESQIISQCNIYEAGQTKLVFKSLSEKAPDKEKAVCGLLRSEEDLFLNGALPGSSSELDMESVLKADEHCQARTVELPSEALKQALQVCTGWQDIPRPPDVA